MRTYVWTWPVAFTVPFDPDNNPYCYVTAYNVQEAIEQVCIGQGTVVGDMIRISFGYDSGASDKWLNYEHYNVDSEKVPPKMDWDMRLIGIAFTNKKSDARGYVEIYRNGRNIGDRVFQFPVDRKLWKFDTLNIEPLNIDFAIGDTLAVYIRKWDGGSDPDTPCVDLDFIVLDNQRAAQEGTTWS